MPGKLNSTSATLAVITLLLACALTNAQTSRPSSTSAPAPTPKPQNQSIVNTSKSNVKDRAVLEPEAASGKGWDGKVQGRAVVMSVEIKFDSANDFDNFVADRTPINFILKNAASGQTVTLASKSLTERFKPSADKSAVTVLLVAHNLLAPVWDNTGCIETLTNAENAADGNCVNITITFNACGNSTTPQNRPGSPIKGMICKPPYCPTPNGRIAVKADTNGTGNLLVTPGASEVVEGSGVEIAARLKAEKIRTNPSANVIGPTTTNKGSGSSKQAGF